VRALPFFRAARSVRYCTRIGEVAVTDFGKTWIAAAFGAALLAALPAQAASVRAATADETRAQTLIADGINAERKRRAPNAAALKTDADLTTIARARSDAIAHGAPFAHEDRPGHFPAIEMVTARFGPAGAIGENLFGAGGTGRRFDPAAFAKQAISTWMASDEHRPNILDPGFDASGIGVAVIGDAAYATQIFRGPPPKAPAAAK
jgi:uncharacterized protein YkwD